MLGRICDVIPRGRSFGRVLALLCAAALTSGRPATASAGDAAAGAPAETGAQEAAPAASASPAVAPAVATEVRMVHAPVSVGKSGEALSIEANFDNAHLLRQAFVVYKLPNGTLGSAVFQRSGSASLAYVAVIPAEMMASPGLHYTIETERVDGIRASVFASRARMHHVQVAEAPIYAVERALLKRLGGRRSTASARFEYVDFGARPTGETASDHKVAEHYWKAELAYTYRLLRTVAEFSMRAGAMRGKSPGVGRREDGEDYKAGIYYAAPSVRLRGSDSWHVEAELLAGLTEDEFAMGLGGALLLGDPYGSKITLGGETIGLWKPTYFGSRFYSRVDFPAGDSLSLAPMIEITDMPTARKLGIRLVGEATLKLSDAVSAALRGGYQARQPESGGAGVSVGLQASVAF